VAASTGQDGARPRVAKGHASLIPCPPHARSPRRWSRRRPRAANRTAAGW
jgi:hypothetical protein